LGRRSVLILTGEPSGDRAAGALARELLRAEPDLRVLAVGGPRLREAGAEILEDIANLGSMGFAEVIRHFPRLLALKRRLRAIIAGERPAVVVPVDYPGFNLGMARFAKRRGVPVVYYISPQVWAWGAGRVPRIAEAVDRMLVVLPFEAELYRRAGVRTDFVGHPLLDDLARSPSRESARGELGIDASAPVLGLLPGSRVQEIRRIFPAMTGTATILRRDHPDLVVLASVAGSVPRPEYERCLDGAAADGVRLVEGPAARICAAADVLVVTSGTATLEAALHGTPLAVVYRTSPLTWFLARRVVKIPRISLVNIVAGEELVAEFLQEKARPERVAEHVSALLDDAPRRRQLGERLAALHERLGSDGVARRAAACVLEEARR